MSFKKPNMPNKVSEPAKWALLEEIAEFVMGTELCRPDFLIAWAEWCKHRQQKQASLTEVAVRRIIIKLEKMGHDRAIAAIEFSIENGYVGIFEPKGQSNTASRPGRVPPPARRGEYPEPGKPPLPRL